MTRSLILVSLIAIPLALSAQSHPDHDITTISTSGKSVSAEKYYRQIELKKPSFDEALELAKEEFENEDQAPVTLESFFPVETEMMRAAEPLKKSVPKLMGTIFIIGMDQRSLRWFEASLPDLRASAAHGLVVQADSYERFMHLQKFARDNGVSLDIAQGDVIADLYGASSYPLVLVAD